MKEFGQLFRFHAAPLECLSSLNASIFAVASIPIQDYVIVAPLAEGVHARRNVTVIVALLVCALSVSSAILLILEMSRQPVVTHAFARLGMSNGCQGSHRLQRWRERRPQDDGDNCEYTECIKGSVVTPPIDDPTANGRAQSRACALCGHDSCLAEIYSACAVQNSRDQDRYCNGMQTRGDAVENLHRENTPAYDEVRREQYAHWQN